MKTTAKARTLQSHNEANFYICYWCRREEPCGCMFIGPYVCNCNCGDCLKDHSPQERKMFHHG